MNPGFFVTHFEAPSPWGGGGGGSSAGDKQYGIIGIIRRSSLVFDKMLAQNRIPPSAEGDRIKTEKNKGPT